MVAEPELRAYTRRFLLADGVKCGWNIMTAPMVLSPVEHDITYGLHFTLGSCNQPLLLLAGTN